MRLDARYFFGPVLLLGGCRAAEDTPHRMLVTDSADVRMVQIMDATFDAGVRSGRALALSYGRGRVGSDAGDAFVISDAAPLGTWEVFRLVPGWNGQAQRIQFDGRTQIERLSNGVVADPMRFELIFHGLDGQPQTITRVEWAHRPVTAEDIQRARSHFLGMEGESGAALPERLRQQRSAIADAWVIGVAHARVLGCAGRFRRPRLAARGCARRGDWSAGGSIRVRPWMRRGG